jgi:hypothetical protein
MPSSPIARSKRLVPRSRHAHHHAGLHVATSNGPSQDRHHPYARSAKSTSPLERAEGSDNGSVLIGVGNKRASARSPTTLVARRRSSNANDSSYSCGSTSMCSSRSQSVSRRGSDGYLNAWTAACKSISFKALLSRGLYIGFQALTDSFICQYLPAHAQYSIPDAISIALLPDHVVIRVFDISLTAPPSAIAMDINTTADAFNASGPGVASLVLLSGMSPSGSSPTHEYHE